jgi:hypothetical protein
MAPPRVSARPPSPPAYLADIETFDGHQQRFYRILQSAGRFRVAQLDRNRHNHVFRLELHDGLDPYLVFDYHPDEKRASPTFASCTSAFWGRTVPALGEAQARARFGVARRRPDPADIHPPAPNPGLTLIESLTESKRRKLGEDLICGRRCDLLEDVYSRPDGQGGVTLRHWIDKETALVLRWERLISSGERSMLPPRKASMQTTEFRLDPPCSLSDFQLPAGTRVWLPETFAQAKLPLGVKLVRVVKGMGIREGTSGK